jgi:hypothetical protein
MGHHTATIVPDASLFKTRLVDIGLDALSRGDWLVVMAITRLIERRDLRHA